MMNKLKTSLSTIIISTLISFNLLNAQAINDAYNKTHDSASRKLIPIDSNDDTYYYYYLDTNNNPKFIFEFLRGIKDTNSYRLNIYFTDKELGRSALRYRPELALISLNGNKQYDFGLKIKNDRIYTLKDPNFNDLYNYNLISPEEVFRFFIDK